jgi:uncharacterized protein YggL (DUF469 family)
MNRRLRKKKHLEEFSVYGFKVTFLFQQNMTAEIYDKFLDDFIEEIEKNIGHCGGGGGPKTNEMTFFCVVDEYPLEACKNKETRKHYVEDRKEKAMAEWPLFYLPRLQEDGIIRDDYKIIRIDFGSIQNAWYGDFDNESQETYTTFVAEAN